MTAIVTDDGLLALPREVCERLGLAAGQSLEGETEGGVLIAWKKSDTDPFDKWRGAGRLPVGQSADEFLRLTRDGDGR